MRFLMLLALLSAGIYAQNDSMILVKKSLLPASVVAQSELESKLQSVGHMAGMGKEIGIAINDGLAAITDQTNRFSNTKVGKFTIIIIAFKVLYIFRFFRF